MNPLFRRLPALLATLLLAACGGGGDGSGTAHLGPPPSRFGASSLFAEVPGDPASCTLERQKRFIRSYLDEYYLWYDEIRQVDAARYDNVPDYFHALLVRTPDANGRPRDQFSAILPASQAEDLLVQLGLDDALATHTDAVPQATVVTSDQGRRVGYLRFDNHDRGAQDDLIAAVRQLRDAGIQDLVLDVRRNSGGFLYVAQTAASLVAGPSDAGRVFEELRYNDKRAAETAARTLFFGNTVQFAETVYPAGTPLPQLNLPRVYMLTSGQTCSSSESIINGLRGIDVQVVLVGSTTCGKPYGFTRKENCGWALFPIEFQGANAKGFGDYTAGFSPTCPVADDPGATPGSNADPLLAAALHHVDHGSCPPAAPAQAELRAGRPAPAQPDRPAWAGRLLGPLR